MADVAAPLRPGWTLHGHASPAASVTLLFFLRLRNLGRLERALHAVSDPTSAKYGQHWSLDAVTGLVAPKREDAHEVLAWLKSRNAHGAALSGNGEFVRLNTNVSFAAELLAAPRYERFCAERLDLCRVRTSGPYHLPRRIAARIDFVGGTTRLPPLPSRSSQSAGEPLGAPADGPPSKWPVPRGHFGADKIVAFTRAQHTPPLTHNQSANVLVAGFLGERVDPKSVHLYQRWFDLSEHGPESYTGAGPPPIKEGSEGALDVEMVYALTRSRANLSYAFFNDEFEGQEPFLEWVANVSTMAYPPPVQSVSYYDKESSLSEAYMRRLDAEFQKLGLRGVTVIACSGDEGSSKAPDAQRVDPSFPASSPHVLAVGGVKGGDDDEWETPKTWDRSGGGFSTLFGQPQHQADAVSAYVGGAPMPHACEYNTSGRAFPDVSSIAQHVCIVVLHSPNCMIFGTSISAPVWAGLVALMNDARASANGPPMGWIGPWLYSTAASHPKAFLKATQGDTQAGCASFKPTASGFDAFQGLGSPSFDVLRPLVLASVPRTRPHERGAVPPGWRLVRRSDPRATVKIYVFAKQQRVERLTGELYAVSDPRSARYGAHLSREQVDRLVAPLAESRRLVEEWLASAGARDVRSTANGDAFTATLTVKAAEALLRCVYSEYEHDALGRVSRVLEYSLPPHVAPHVDFVGPTVRFPSSAVRAHSDEPHGRRLSEGLCHGTGDNCPASVRADVRYAGAYGIGDATADAPGNSIGATGFLEQYLSVKSLHSFFDAFDPTAPKPQVKIVGTNTMPKEGAEADLDIMYASSIASAVPSVQFLSFAGRAPDNPANEPFLEFMLYLANHTDVPLVITSSYSDNENTVSDRYRSRLNIEFQKAGARGVTLVFSSGDGGVGGTAMPGANISECHKFQPTFPPGSPYVLAVGGTVDGPPSPADSQSGWEWSAGGFSWELGAPDYQRGVREQYVSACKAAGLDLPEQDKWNAGGRAIPDVAGPSQSVGIKYGCDSRSECQDWAVGGTSAAAPIWAGVLSLLNADRLRVQQPPLGFVNPLLYSLPSDAFKDVTHGRNMGCHGTGFSAARGWDPVTGLGEPNFPKLANHSLAAVLADRRGVASSPRASSPPSSRTRPAPTFPDPPGTFWSKLTHARLNADGSTNLSWTDYVAYDCDGSVPRARTLKETKTNLTVTYLNWYGESPKAGNIQPFYARMACDIFPAGQGDECPRFTYPGYIRGMHFLYNGTVACAAGTCDVWQYDNVFTYLFDAASGDPVRLVQHKSGGDEVYTFEDLKTEAPPEWLWQRRTPSDNSSCIDFTQATPQHAPPASASSASWPPIDAQAPVNAPSSVAATRAAIRAAGLSWRAGPSPSFEGWSWQDAVSHLDQSGVNERALFTPSMAATSRAHGASPPVARAATPLPDSFDARTQWPGCVGPIQDQKGCGSCWAFGATESLHDRLCIAGVSNVSLSAQWLVACEADQSGCGGGYADNTRHFLQEHGTVSAQCLPYSDQPSTVKCTGKCADGSAPSTFYKAAGSQDPGTAEEGIMRELMSRGPVAAAMYVFSDFMHYAGGVYTRTSGSSLLGGHEIKIIGWGQEPSGQKWWLCQNSWGVGPSASHPGWGEDGFFRILRGVEECAIEQRASALLAK